MRTIFENDGEEDFFEIILNEGEVDKIERHQGVGCVVSFGFKNINVFVRKEKQKE